jgi:hypothetical protein
MLAVLHSFLLHSFSNAMANPFDLNVRLEEDDGDVDLNEPILEDDTTNGNVLLGLFGFFVLYSKQERVVTFLIFFLLFWTGFDLNLPLDDFGAIDFDYLQNLAGNFFSHFVVSFSPYLQ